MTNPFKNYSQKTVSLIVLIGFNISLMAFRMLVTGTIGYGFLVWNLFLSGVPMLISSNLKAESSSVKFVTLNLIWLLFLPNAPYILTDFLHFRNLKATMPAWFDLLLLASYSINGLLLGLGSMAQMQSLWKIRFGRLSSAILIPVCALLSGFGIYLGRFERYNSWDILSNPMQLLLDSAQIATELRTIGFSLGYGSLLLILYFFFKPANLKS